MSVPKVFLRAPYNYDVEAASDEAGLKCLDKSRAQQSFRDEVDINTLIKRFGLDGQLPQNVRMPVQGDFTDLPADFHALANAQRQAQESFDAMPARVRARFHHDAGEFVDFCLDPANAAEAKALGLVAEVVEPPPSVPLKVEVVNPAPADSVVK